MTNKISFLIACSLCLIFFLAYAVLALVRHDHYQSYGYDLGINDQAVWRYSTFQAPVTTIDPYPDKTKLYTHVELVYAFIAPFYWIWNSEKMLLLLEKAFVCAGGIAIYLLAKKKGLRELLSLAVMIGYLGFYGVQNAIWVDVHSVSFAAAFLAWFIYFLDGKKLWGTIIFFLLAMTAKENIALYLLSIAFIYFLKRRDKTTMLLMLGSATYLFFIFYIYFPQIIHFHYPYQNKAGLLSNLNPLDLFNTPEKRQAIGYALMSFGFLPLLLPWYLLPTLANFATYFVIASDLPGAQGLFGQYRITLAPFLAWATILTIAKYKKLNSPPVAIYLLLWTMFVQYFLHLPLSYLSKSWFWQEPAAVKNINLIRNNDLPRTASVVAQNNIIPHISHRDKIYELYPEKKSFTQQSPCGKPQCNWFRWYNDPEFLFVDTSPEWDIRHFLADRPDYLDGLANLEKAGIIQKYKQIDNAILYKVLRNPNLFDAR